ncbi:hypothetical protein OGAPHI_001014 [Ogataea philodendri]|uniref:Zn(2)-C6 fungal-type domain-containing protein n=1 Tax=Ogataea philodendri TaxID=1378263 RepID=A0A9P8PFW5_9ASCO|nr:uncharacterized protein OGAPHI_001014 [Ogataea philodendri]KAH3670499.1 hypothetical protein OGAPHI_001014 [Ogataea philodendri]
MSQDRKNPWNLIKNPVNGRTRISQACDRCRSRKIKCSGKSDQSPRCTNCERDGFQCVVSDKLTRNSFPKGYTKNLEKKLLEVELDRNRLMLEVRELRELHGLKGESAPQVKLEDSPGACCDSLTNRPAVDSSGALVIDQYLVSPLQKHIDQLQLNLFNGYEKQSSAMSESEQKMLANYHMNLNRYLNLVLYKLVFPLLADKSEHSLDHLIWLFFNDLNKLIPVLDFELFYNDYLTFINHYTPESSTYVENGESKKKYHEFSPKEQDFLVKLILVLKFALPSPRAAAQSSVLNKQSPNQFEEAIKLINNKNLSFLFRNINFVVDPSLDKFEIVLLMMYHLLKFENYHIKKDQQPPVPLLRDILNVCVFLSRVFSLNTDSDQLSFEPELAQTQKIHRLRLYWSLHSLTKLFEIFFNIQVRKDLRSPRPLESVQLASKDLDITIKLVQLLDIVPYNFMSLSEADLLALDAQLDSWNDLESIVCKENKTAVDKLKSYYHYFKLNLYLRTSHSQLPALCAEIVQLAVGLVDGDVEKLALNSFNFHLTTLLALAKLEAPEDRPAEHANLCALYSQLATEKLCDPVVEQLVKHVTHPLDAEDLHSFTYSLAPSSLFKRKEPELFDLAAFESPAEYRSLAPATDPAVERASKRHRHRASGSPPSPSSSVFSSISRASSISSNRLSIGSVDAPSCLFASASAAGPTQKERSALYETYSQSVTGNLNNGLRRLRNNEGRGRSRSMAESFVKPESLILNDFKVSLNDQLLGQDSSEMEQTEDLDQLTNLETMDLFAPALDEPRKRAASFRDDDDLNKLKEKVLTMKYTST